MTPEYEAVRLKASRELAAMIQGGPPFYRDRMAAMMRDGSADGNDSIRTGLLCFDAGHAHAVAEIAELRVQLEASDRCLAGRDKFIGEFGYFDQFLQYIKERPTPIEWAGVDIPVDSKS